MNLIDSFSWPGAKIASSRMTSFEIKIDGQSVIVIYLAYLLFFVI